MSVMDPLYVLKDEAIKKAQASGNLEDVERVASVYKLMAEAQKRSAEAAAQTRMVRQEGLKNWAALLVPLLSVLTLAVILWSQIQQQRESLRSREDGEWLAVINEFRSASTATNAPTIEGLLPQVRLKPFMKSPIYGDQANQLARLLLPRIADPDGFRDLFAAVEWHDLNQMLNVDRGLNRLYDYLGRERRKLEASDSRAVPAGASPGPAAAAGGTRGRSAIDPRVEQLSSDQGNISSQTSYVCKRIGDMARSGKLPSTGLDLDDCWFNYCDLSRVDWNGATLNGTLFQHVNLEGARFADVTEVENLDIANTAWWQAAELSPSLLKALMENFDPGTETQRELTEKPTKPAYVARVTQLCKTAKMNCPQALIKFTVPASPTKGTALGNAAQ
jgi:hypothetical protein